jgi:hypothetical protein
LIVHTAGNDSDTINAAQTVTAASAADRGDIDLRITLIVHRTLNNAAKRIRKVIVMGLPEVHNMHASDDLDEVSLSPVTSVKNQRSQ